MKEEFEIICINDCEDIAKLVGYRCKRGDRFIINNYEFNYASDYLRLITDNKIVGLFLRTNFIKLSDNRDKKIEEILEK